MITEDQYNDARNIIIEYRRQLVNELGNIDKLVLEYKTPIRNINLSTRMYNCIRAYGCDTIGDILSTPISEFRRLRNWGKKSEAELIKLKKEFNNIK